MGDLDYRFESEAGGKCRVLYSNGYGPDVLRELARLATESSERKADKAQAGGSRIFSHEGQAWRIFAAPGKCPLLFEMTGAGDVAVKLSDRRAPHEIILCREFAALGREQGFAQKIDALESATRERIATLQRECDTWRDGCAVDQRDLVAARERIAELEASLDRAPESLPFIDPSGFHQTFFENSGIRWKIEIEADPDCPPTLHRSLGGGHWQMEDMDSPEAPATAQLAKLLVALGRDQGRAESAARIAELETQLAAEKDRAEKAGLAASEWQGVATRNAESWHIAQADAVTAQRGMNEQKARADGLVKIGVATSEAMHEEWLRAEAAEKRLADLESTLADRMENFAAGCAAGAAAVTKAIMGAEDAKGDPRRMVSFESNEAGQWALAADGTAWFRPCRNEGPRFDGDPEPVPGWTQIPPIPPIESEPEIEANRPEPEAFAARIPASVLSQELGAALRNAVRNHDVRIPALHGETCSRCGFWAATEGMPEMPVCAKCRSDIEERCAP